jgi:NAD(P)-dependent dehydrogenase (short-subunit alcohol dehydrogenase family)
VGDAVINLRERVAIVTGASSGLGEAIARKLAAEGTRTVLAARSKDKLDVLAADIKAKGGTALAVTTDVTKEADILNLIETTMATHGRLDILINNAGIAVHKPTIEVTTPEWEHIVATNLTSAFIASREAMKIMKEQKRGRIINIGSVSATVPRAHTVGYAATKFALDGLTHSMALDGREYGITVSILHPGVADSALGGGRRADRPPEVMMQASEIADIVHLMVTLPDTTNLYHTLVLPIGMPFLGRG